MTKACMHAIIGEEECCKAHVCRSIVCSFQVCLNHSTGCYIPSLSLCVCVSSTNPYPSRYRYLKRQKEGKKRTSMPCIPTSGYTLVPLRYSANRTAMHFQNKTPSLCIYSRKFLSSVSVSYSPYSFFAKTRLFFTIPAFPIRASSRGLGR